MELVQNRKSQELAQRLKINCLEEALYFPKYFEVETINICNAKCVMCTVGNWKKRKNAIMSEALFAKFVQEVTGYADWIETVCLSRDGEPTLDKCLPERIKMLKEVGIKKVTFATNGQLLTSGLIHQLIDGGLDDIMISIDAATKQTFEAIRIRLNYDVVLKNTLELINIRNRRRSKMTIRIRMAVMEENRHELQDWLKFWKAKVYPQDRVYAKPIHTWGNQLGKEAKDMVAKYASLPCISPFSTMIIKVDGKVALCGLDYRPQNILGNFAQQSIKEIWNAESYREVRMLHVSERRNEISLCIGCQVWDLDLLLR